MESLAVELLAVELLAVESLTVESPAVECLPAKRRMAWCSRGLRYLRPAGFGRLPRPRG